LELVARTVDQELVGFVGVWPWESLWNLIEAHIFLKAKQSLRLGCPSAMDSKRCFYHEKCFWAFHISVNLCSWDFIEDARAFTALEFVLTIHVEEEEIEKLQILDNRFPFSPDVSELCQHSSQLGTRVLQLELETEYIDSKDDRVLPCLFEDLESAFSDPLYKLREVSFVKSDNC
jgi:hypothetical protein